MKIAAEQVAVVTGAASGIGFALCEALAARGVKLVMADVNAELLSSASQRLSASTAVATHVGDVAQAATAQALSTAALDSFGRIDLVINNAGVVLPFRPMWEHSADDWEWLMGINLSGVIHGIRTFVPQLVRQGSGHIVNTASMAGMSIIPMNGPYNAAKHAVVSLTETLAGELADRAPGVRATVVCPGKVPTRIAPRGSAPGDPATKRPLPETERHAISAVEAAARILAGIEADEVYIFTNPGSRERIEARFAAVREAYRPWN